MLLILVCVAWSVVAEASASPFSLKQSDDMIWNHLESSLTLASYLFK